MPAVLVAKLTVFLSRSWDRC